MFNLGMEGQGRDAVHARTRYEYRGREKRGSELLVIAVKRTQWRIPV